MHDPLRDPVPWRELVISTGGAAWGTVVHHLCLLAIALGREEAGEHLQDAAAMHERLGAPVWLAQTHVARAGMLIAGDDELAAMTCGDDLRAAVATARGAAATGLEQEATCPCAGQRRPHAGDELPMSESRTKVAILGGAPAGFTAAFELTATPELRAKYEVTVHQLGWRLGGEGPAATARCATASRSTDCTCGSAATTTRSR